MRVPLYRKIALDIGAQILHGGLRPGDRLPSALDLVREYRSNLDTIQQAVNILKIQGILRTVPGDGRFVTNDAQRICREKGY